MSPVAAPHHPRPLRRSMVLVPGHKADWLHKAQSFAADVLVLDLQDSVPLDPDTKLLARNQVARLLQQRDFQAREVSIRVNGPLTPWLIDDVRMAVETGADSVTLPEVRALRELLFLEGLIDHFALGTAGPGPTVLLEVETPELLCTLESIAQQCMRVDGLCVAPFDYALNTEAQTPLLGRPGMLSDTHLAWLRPKVVAVARAHGWSATDAVVVPDPKNLELVVQGAQRARQSGFDGSAVLHPSHIESINRCFSPSEEEVAWARGVLERPDPQLRQQVQLAQRLLLDQDRINDTRHRRGKTDQ